MKWGSAEIKLWFDEQSIQRSYQDNIILKLKKQTSKVELINYGRIDDYILYAVKSLNWSKCKPSILITGGVHGYETSGVHGALDFIENELLEYSDDFNIMVVPCVSPWGYETINRWNSQAVDPNRSFSKGGQADESRFLMSFIKSQRIDFKMHIDLHETTDTDNSVFRPALASRDGLNIELWDIPDGFYLVGDIEAPVDEFQSEIIKEVRKVTHIAPSDKQNRLIGVKISQEGVINYKAKDLGLCMSLTNAEYRTTTEVYPDSVNVTLLDCRKAQVNAILGAIKYLKEKC
jgi:hypothetical protein